MKPNQPPRGGGVTIFIGLDSANASIVIKPSELVGAGDGLFVTSQSSGLPKGAVFGPYRGDWLGAERLRVLAKGGPGTVAATAYLWCPDEVQERMNEGVWDPGSCIDASHLREGNPMRFINGARTPAQCGEVNVQFCQFGGLLYARTIRSVPAGSELLTDYGEYYFDAPGAPCTK